MSDNKDLTEFEAKVKDIYFESIGMFKGSNWFVEQLRQIMPPTCTETERKFLDEIKERSWYVTNPALNLFCIEIRSKHSNVILHQSDYKTNLKELVE